MMRRIRIWSLRETWSYGPPRAALRPAEGIAFERVPFIDNQPVLDLIERKPDGLLLALDDEVRKEDAARRVRRERSGLVPTQRNGPGRAAAARARRRAR